MKKIKKLTFILAILLIEIQSIPTAFVMAHEFNSLGASYDSQKKSTEAIYKDIIMSLLLPYVQDEVTKYYSKYLKYPPMAAPYTIHVLSVDRIDNLALYKLKLQVSSYTGPHIDVGLDNITVIVEGAGDVKIEKFEHIKSYKLPQSYEDMIKEGYTNPIP